MVTFLTPRTGLAVSLSLLALAAAPLHAAPAASTTAPQPAAGAATPSQPTGIAAIHRDGQTFLTWDASVDATVDRYRIYRHDAPIDAGSLASATMIWEGWKGSGDFHADRYFKPKSSQWEARYHDRFVIETDGAELAPGKELLVWTINDADLGGQASLDAYYAVTSFAPGTGENITDFNGDNTIGPITESVDHPSPVRTMPIVGGEAYVYIQYLDCRDYNVTFNAPNLSNEYYGLDPQDPSIANAVAYALTYAIFPPEQNGCGGLSSYPAMVILHGQGGNNIRPITADPDPTWCPVFRIYPTDTRNTWWFGHARDHDYRVDLDVQPGDVVENYTEQRVLRMLRDLSRDPELGSTIDMDRVFLQGHSMGGSGTLAMALRYPNVFAAAHASQPMTNYQTVGNGGGFDWKPDMEVMWGSIADGVPVELDAPEGLADHLKVHDGTPAWDWQNHQQNLIDRRGDDFVPFGTDHGLQDLVIEFSTQGEPVYQLLDDSLACWAGEVQDALHQESGLSTIPTPYEAFNGLPFHGFQAILSETVPGLGDFSDDPALPPTASGFYADSVTWSASWDAWDVTPVDLPDVWRISLRTDDGGTRTVDVTPRRTQNFVVDPGAEYLWTNVSVATGLDIASGWIEADADGLLVVDDFLVTGTGNRLILRKALRATGSSTISLSAGGSQALSLWAGGDQAGNFYVVLGSFSGDSPGTPFGGEIIPLNIDSYFNFTLVNPYSGPVQPAFSVLDAEGKASASFTIPPGTDPSLAGVTAHHAFLTIDPPAGLAIEVISNAVSVTLAP